MDLRDDGRWPTLNHVVRESRSPWGRTPFMEVDGSCEFSKCGRGVEGKLELLLESREVERGRKRLP